MNAENAAITIHFAPLLDQGWLYAIIISFIALIVLSFFFHRRGLLWRSICALGFLLVFLNPSLTEETREQVSDIAVIVVDRSPSQNNGERMSQTDKALSYFKNRLENLQDIELRIVEAPVNKDIHTTETNLFYALDQALNDVPVQRRAGVIFLSDGQIHDIPASSEHFDDYGPVHLFLSGDKNEKDRQLVIIEAPSYGIVGQNVTIRYRVEDTENINEDFATVLIRQDDQSPRIDVAPTNRIRTLEVTIDHAGQNIIDLEASPLDNEITEANNRVPLIINGVRDRLRVLLVSGLPHPGERAWRNILTADPGVDLVHFTILREQNKMDITPQRELSLIAFPFRELFETKLYDFDLIIFDRYRLNQIMPSYYFNNIARYVKEGGGFLEASGPSFAGNYSIFKTALKDVLPGQPSGPVLEQAFTPELTTLGKHHPVTERLHHQNYSIATSSDPQWGRWFRQIQVTAKRGDVLMTGIRNSPLLILDRVGKGRVAQLASDHIWLWARGFDGGGPQAELLRRLAHWLMKEPELEENALDIQIDGKNMTIRRRTTYNAQIEVTVKHPGNIKETLSLRPGQHGDDGWMSGQIKITEAGIYAIDDGIRKRFVIVGDINPPELRGVIATDKKLAPMIKKSGGKSHWLSDTPTPDIRLLAHAQTYGGKNWIGLRKNNRYHVSGIKDTPMLPAWFSALFLLLLMIAAWWFEGRSSTKGKN